MKKHFSRYLGKTVMSLAAFFWAGCSDNPNNASEDPSLIGAKVDVNKVIENMGGPDTTGLRGTTVSAFNYCNVVYSSRFDSDPSEVSDAIKDARKSFEASSAGSKISSKQKKCLDDAASFMVVEAMYGVVACPGLTDREVDQEYIDAIVDEYESRVSEIKHELERYNERVDVCDEKGELPDPLSDI
ncbi:MAG: hypothetical protein MJZ05_09755 [Fibrobacter sp.]|nr:hypothetical protein [Fibrobacter sp.]